MKRRSLPNGSLQLTELGFGGSQIGNLYRATTDDDALGAVRAAWDAGVRYFDTAPHYGLGLSERLLGAVLQTLPPEEIVVSTKVGRLLVPTCRSGEPDQEGRSTDVRGQVRGAGRHRGRGSRGQSAGSSRGADRRCLHRHLWH
ncbi:MAG: aldo/keto reductase [Micromonosporaceae bacterium]|nr:aldo/keto reductase [Micromonosporaceae bacterium]